MKIIHAIYRFQLQQAWQTSMFLLQPILKRGNDVTLNQFFETKDLVSRKKIGPIKQIIDQYEAYPIVFLNNEGKKQTMVFEIGNKEMCIGVVKVVDNKKDCFLFKVVEENVFEVYVSVGNGTQSSQLLMMLMDGYLDKEIAVLLGVGTLHNKTANPIY